MYKYYNPNPAHQYTGDCVIRAISKCKQFANYKIDFGANIAIAKGNIWEDA